MMFSDFILNGQFSSFDFLATKKLAQKTVSGRLVRCYKVTISEETVAVHLVRCDKAPSKFQWTIDLARLI